MLLNNRIKEKEAKIVNLKQELEKMKKEMEMKDL